MSSNNPQNINSLSPDANQENVFAGAFDEDRKKRRLRAMIKILIRESPSLSKTEKDDILGKLNQFVLAELEKTKTHLQKEGQAVRKDQQRVEKLNDINS